MTTTLSQARTAFAHESGPLAEQALVKGAPIAVPRGRASRMVWLETAEALAVVVGAHEAASADDALALSLAVRADRRLVLMLPEGFAVPTLARWAWLRDDLPLEVWTHEGGVAQQAGRPERRALPVRRPHPPAPLTPAMVAWVEELLRWAGDRRDLDPAHSPAARAWACHGQEVLRVERDGQAQLTITSGEVVEHVRGLLPAHALRHLQGAVRTRVQERLTGGADEAWFRAALRRFPRGIGLEEPALRAVPVRRRAADQPAAAGTVDVLGVDATGRVVAVEPALGADDTFVLRGLDDVAYLGHALATDQELGLRLGLPEQVELELAFCVGATGGRAALSKHARAQLAALAPDVRWHVQSVHGWAEGRPLGRRYPVGVVPESLG